MGRALIAWVLCNGCGIVCAFCAELAVPFIAQRPGCCGPAALAMVAGYYGRAVSQDEIAAATYHSGVGGVLTTDLAEQAQRLGFWARAYSGDLAELRRKLGYGVPLILLTRWGKRDHFLVAIGANKFDRSITVHTDTRPSLELSEEQLLRYWDRAARWTLLVAPPDRVTWRLSAEEHNDFGLFLERSGRYMAAAGHYRLAAEMQPRNATFHFNLGNAMLKQKLFAEAANAFRRAIELAPENADALNNLAWCWCQLGANLDEAAALCRRAVALRPSQRAYYLDTLGHVLLRQGRREEARAVFAEALAATTDRQGALREAIRKQLAQP
ncbi:MAG: tetratricopeptide repeat protein [Verrucomicrobiae bacterium]|nr:tetratricopeptide repeat protein [Verrucomicrobiae bacterium]